MARAERRRAESERRKPRALFEADYLLGVNDESRQGALRFRLKQDGPFLAPDDAQRIPPLIELPRLLSAAERAANDEDSDEDLKLLLAPGSSLGGARPKASVRDRDGALALAKFPRPQDETNVVLWECTALSLAKKAGIDVPEWRIETPAGKAVLIMRRFDRDGARRIPFLSAMSMLGAADHETRSYLEIADALMQHGAAAKEDLVQLWRRIVFSVLVSNTDDHLRNHGFLYQGHQGWRLSPVYDLNPVPFEDLRPFLKTSIGLDDRTASIDLALETADYYGLKLKDAKSIAHDVARAASGWRREAGQLGAAPREIERMASAFEHEESRKALAVRVERFPSQRNHRRPSHRHPGS
ncbi:MAG: type II toxin-antitoxin system HipA family toxin [Rhodospirillales bacterium]